MALPCVPAGHSCPSEYKLFGNLPTAELAETALAALERLDSNTTLEAMKAVLRCRLDQLKSDTIVDNIPSIQMPLSPGVALESFRLDAGEENDDAADFFEEDWAGVDHRRKNVTLPSCQGESTSKGTSTALRP